VARAFQHLPEPNYITSLAARSRREEIMAEIDIPVRRDQFNITPEGIVHKPTDAAFIPSPGDPLKGTFRLGSLGAALPNGDKFRARAVDRMMRELWKEYVKANQALFK
jgi:hypothetical protein